MTQPNPPIERLIKGYLADEGMKQQIKLMNEERRQVHPDQAVRQHNLPGRSQSSIPPCWDDWGLCQVAQV
jgi:hypothetical protein